MSTKPHFLVKFTANGNNTLSDCITSETLRIEERFCRGYFRAQKIHVDWNKTEKLMVNILRGDYYPNCVIAGPYRFTCD